MFRVQTFVFFTPDVLLGVYVYIDLRVRDLPQCVCRVRRDLLWTSRASVLEQLSCQHDFERIRAKNRTDNGASSYF